MALSSRRLISAGAMPEVMRSVKAAGFEIGIHCHNHYRWQDYVRREDGPGGHTRGIWRGPLGICPDIRKRGGDCGRSRMAEQRKVAPGVRRGRASCTQATPGAIALSSLGSTAACSTPWKFRAPFPPLTNFWAVRSFPNRKSSPHYLALLKPDRPNVFTLHAEIEGMGRRDLFRALMSACRDAGVEFIRMDDLANELLAKKDEIPVVRPGDGRNRRPKRPCRLA